MINEKIKKRFFRKVEIIPFHSCWEWTACLDMSGYGQMNIGAKKSERAHRISWIIHNGKIPDLLCVLHKCDNRSCVNPDHLFLGTRQDNNADMMAKGRKVTVKGAKHRLAKLIDSQVVEIRKKRAQGAKLTDLSETYGVSVSVISKICLKKTWAHI